VSSFLAAIRTIQNESIRGPLLQLYRLFCITNVEKRIESFISSKAIDVEQIPLFRKAIKILLHRIRPDAVALTDAFSKSDYELNSAIGNFDGDYINTLYRWASQDPFNIAQNKYGGKAIPGYQEYLCPFMGNNNQSKL